MADFISNHAHNMSITRWLIAGLAIWLACLILFIVRLCVDAPKADRDMNEHEYRQDYWDDPE